MITCSTSSGATPARSSAALIAKPPSSAALNDASAPLILPIGVRAPATMYEPAMRGPPVRRPGCSGVDGHPIREACSGLNATAMSAQRRPEVGGLVAERPDDGAAESGALSPVDALHD